MMVYTATGQRVMMGEAVRISPPAALPLSLAELKAHCQVDHTASDAMLMFYLRSAVENAENYTGLSLITQTWKQTVSAFPAGPIPLLRRPLQSVVSIEALDASAAAALIDPTVYAVSGIGAQMRYSTVSLANGQAWPTPYVHPEAVKITYVAGFGDDHNSVPESIRHALAFIVRTSYDYTTDIVQGAAIAELPAGSKALLDPWRPIGIA